MFDGPYFVWRVVYSEGSPLGGMFLYLFVFLSLSCLRGWINFLFATSDQMVYTIYLEITIHIPYSIFHTLCYM